MQTVWFSFSCLHSSDDMVRDGPPIWNSEGRGSRFNQGCAVATLEGRVGGGLLCYTVSLIAEQASTTQDAKYEQMHWKTVCTFGKTVLGFHVIQAECPSLCEVKHDMLLKVL